MIDKRKLRTGTVVMFIYSSCKKYKVIQRTGEYYICKAIDDNTSKLIHWTSLNAEVSV